MEVNQIRIATVNQNSITGPASYTNAIAAIKSSLNNTLTVKCNTTSATYYGLNFNGAQALTTVQDNIMQSQTYGLSLTNTATIGQQGNSTTPTNNQWLGTWTGTTTGTFKTMNYNVYSSAANSKLYATWGGTLDPNGTGTLIASPSTPNQDEYFHFATVNPLNTIINASSISPTCRIAGGGGGGGGRFAAPDSSLNDLGPQFSLMEMLIGDTSLNSGIAPSTAFIGKNTVYRQLNSELIDASGNNVLTTFYNASQNSAMQKFFDIESDLQNGDYQNAQPKISALTSTNSVVMNYQAFYNLYLKTKNGTFNGASTALLNLCNSCPYTNGGVVYQARALYNIMNATFERFDDNCPEGNANRLFETVIKNVTDINVVLRSKIYPNPNAGEFNIELTGSKEGKKVEISIYDVLGKIVYNEIRNIAESMIHLKPHLPNGTYVVKVKLPEGETDIHRLIIEK